ncbi:MAG: hypothetical protein KKB74_02805, partial [Bacteroidetes bacterium]|nr:hypothetical protein [Bacteroidota bacterium]
KASDSTQGLFFCHEVIMHIVLSSNPSLHPHSKTISFSQQRQGYINSVRACPQKAFLISAVLAFAAFTA